MDADMDKPANDNKRVKLVPWPTTKALAKSLGSKQYFTGEVCKRGHILPRLTSNGACLGCHSLTTNASHKRRADSDDEYRLARNARRREDYDPEKNAVLCREWAERNKDYVRIYNREYQRMRSTDPEFQEMKRRSARKRRSDPEYREIQNARSRERYADNPEPHREKTKRYFEENPEKAATYARNRRAKLRDAEGTHTDEDVERILNEQDFRCVYCDVDISDEYHIDHITPISRGGSNWPDNLQGLCPPCNLSKSSLTDMEFRMRLAAANDNQPKSDDEDDAAA